MQNSLLGIKTDFDKYLTDTAIML